jgi:hypothetical protein
VAALLEQQPRQIMAGTVLTLFSQALRQPAAVAAAAVVQHQLTLMAGVAVLVVVDRAALPALGAPELQDKATTGGQVLLPHQITEMVAAAALMPLVQMEQAQRAAMAAMERLAVFRVLQ